MPKYSSGPYRKRTWIRSNPPWFLIDLGIAPKGQDCETAGGEHEWYNIENENSDCYHYEILQEGQLGKRENK